ncbi:hypothetical protein Vadar_017253 [Vaccinium darrowii]|uniref:Uncharacterized protein n=1 Tax=Vaccinium darrowii TaxID=229202 RepID=A0ACB7XAT3_9ERIC|nr:hypothetical protein Vadar_017253 [Vaccinium darrowii]
MWNKRISEGWLEKDQVIPLKNWWRKIKSSQVLWKTMCCCLAEDVESDLSRLEGVAETVGDKVEDSASGKRGTGVLSLKRSTDPEAASDAPRPSTQELKKENIDVALALTKVMMWSTWAPSLKSPRNSSKPKTSTDLATSPSWPKKTNPLLDGLDQILAVIDILSCPRNVLTTTSTTTPSSKSTTITTTRTSSSSRNTTAALPSSSTPTRIAPAFCFVASDLVKKLSFDNKLNFYSKVDLFPTRIVHFL